MFNRLKAFVFGDDKQEKSAFPVDDPRLALAALLVHLSRIDGMVSPQEKATIRAALSERFHLAGEDLDRLIEAAEARDNEAIDLYGYTAILKARLGEDERVGVIAMLWDIVFADGTAHEFEDNLVWRVAELIGVSTRDRVTLRQRIRAREQPSA